MTRPATEPGRRQFVGAALVGSGLGWGQATPNLRWEACPIVTEAHRDMANPAYETLYSTVASDTSLIGEAANRVALRTLIDAWAHCADRRLAEQQASLFTASGGYAVHDGEPEG